MPLPLVVAVALLGVAPAGLSVAVTTTPLWLTGLPLPSCSWSTGCCANATPLCAALEGDVVKASRPAAPAVPSAVRVTGLPVIPDPAAVAVSVFRSEERRVGKEGRSWWSPDHLKKKTRGNRPRPRDGGHGNGVSESR